MIALQHVSKTFFSGLASGVTALDDVSLDLKQGEAIVLAGSNGSGKTTLLNIISGSIIADAGKIFFNGADITRMPEHKRASFIARIFQNPLSGTAPQLTLAENFRLAAIRAEKKCLSIRLTRKFKEDIAQKIAALQLGLETKINTPMGHLSGGQRQALTLLMASMSGAKIILMDEPAAALDPKTGALVMQLAEKIIREQNLTAVLVTHHIKDMLNFGDRLLFMREGKILKDISGKSRQQLSASEIVQWFE